MKTIAFTAHGNSDMIEASGFDRCIQKPTDPDEFLAVIQELMTEARDSKEFDNLPIPSPNHPGANRGRNSHRTDLIGYDDL